MSNNKVVILDGRFQPYNEGNPLKTETVTNGESVTVQNPIPSDGDSVYVKDLDIPNCDNGNFSGDVTDYFDSLKSINTDVTANNPKSIKLWFKRTVYSHAIGFGCDDLTKGFGTSITIKLLGSGEAVRFTKTYTTADGTSFLAEFGSRVFNGIIIEFNTASEVCLSNLTIQKATHGNVAIEGETPDGVTKNVQVSQDGYLSIEDNSSGLSIAEGHVTGKSFIHKFGNAPDFDTADGEVVVWDGANDADIAQMNYVYSTTAIIDSLSSSDNGDVVDIEVQGLDADYNLVVQTITLTGQTRVPLTTNLIRVFRLKNVGSVDLVGYVYCYENTALSGGVPTDTTKVRAVIENGNNQTEMAVYTVPAGKTAFVRSWFAASAGSNKVTNYIIRLKARPFGQVFQLKHRSAIGNASPIQHLYVEPSRFTEKTDLVITAQLTATGVTGASVSAGFDIVLVDN